MDQQKEDPPQEDQAEKPPPRERSAKTLPPSRPPRTNRPTLRNNSNKAQPPKRFSPYNQNIAREVENHRNPAGYLSQTKNYFIQQVSFDGIKRIAELCYDTLRAREPRSVSALTRTQFVYGVKLIVFVRMYFIARRAGIEINDDMYYLESMVDRCKTLVLPDLLASYIDSIGVNTVNFKRILPYIPPPREFVESGFFEDPNDNGQNITYDNFRTVYTLGHFDTSFIRVRTIAHSLRTMNFGDIMGRLELLACYHMHHDGILLTPSSTTSMAVDSAMKGACYQFWNADEFKDRGDYEQFPISFSGHQFAWEDFIRGLLSNAIVPMPEQI